MAASHSPDDQVYIPFWLALELIPVPKHAFYRCTVRWAGARSYGSPEGSLTLAVADLELAPGLLLQGIPLDNLIAPDELPQWQQRIANWILTDIPAKDKS